MKYLIVLMVVILTGCGDKLPERAYKYQRGDAACVYNDPDMRVRIYHRLSRYSTDYDVIFNHTGEIVYFKQSDLGECPQ